MNTSRAVMIAAALAASPALAGPRVPVAFHAPWDAASAASLTAHRGAISTVAPAWIAVTGPDHALTVAADPAGHAALAGAGRAPRLMVVVQNALNGRWDGTGAAALLADTDAQARFAGELAAALTAAGAAGAVIDLEALPPGSTPALAAFLGRVRAVLASHGLALWACVPVGDADEPAAALAPAVDRVVLMAYDQHWQGGEPGPIAAEDWFRARVAAALGPVPRAKAIVAVASYGYDWTAGGPTAVVSVAAARALAAANGTVPQLDGPSGNEWFAYTDAAGRAHTVWFVGATAAAAELAAARRLGAGVALWRLGTEDPALWSR